MAASRKRKKTSARKRKKEFAFRREITLWIVLAVSVLLFVGNFGFGGSVGGVCSKLLFGILGLIAYAFPVFLFIGCAFFLSNKDNPAAWIKLAACFVFMFFLCVFLQMVSEDAMSMDFKSAYTYCSANRTGGGAVGTVIAGGLTKSVGKAGTFIIDILVLIICLILVTEKSIFKGLQKGGKKAYASAKSNRSRQQLRKAEKRRKAEEEQAALAEERARRAEEEHARREEKRKQREEEYLRREEERKRQAEERRKQEEERKRQKETKNANEPLQFEKEKAKKRPDKGPLLFEDDGAESRKRGKNAGRRMDRRVSGITSDTNLSFPVGRKSDGLNELSAKNVPVREIIRPIREETFPYIDTDLIKKEVSEQQPESVHTESFEESTIPEAKPGAQAEIPASREIVQPEPEVLPEPEMIQPEPETILPESEVSPEPGQKAAASGVPAAVPVNTAAASGGFKEEYRFPPIELLSKGSGRTSGDSEMHVRETAMKLQQTLKTFGVNVTITEVSCGPSVTRYELQPEMGVKVSKIVGLSDDIKLNLAAEDIRIEAPIPGKAAIGIEVPNKENVTVAFRDLIASKEFQNHKSNIAFGVGKDIAGKVVVADIAKMPHLLIAGATGSGKSVCINTIIMSILYHAHPDDVKLIMIDPKVVELSVYNGIPHLFIPVVTDPKKAAGALHWAVAEMTERYQKFAELNVRDLAGYNKKIETIESVEEEGKPEKMPQIVIIVDELADLMMVAPGDVEDAICRLAQLARACGIHLIIATQRPSVNVITGLIKANMPSRIAFAVSSGVDSRTIIDMNGAEKLLGKGDMLFYPQGLSKPKRVQGAFVSDPEVGAVVDFLKEQVQDHSYNPEIAEKVNALSANKTVDIGGGQENGRDSYFADAGRLIVENGKASIGMLQRHLKVGFNRAARIMDQLSEAGVVGPEEGTKPRKVLMSAAEFEEFVDESV